MKHRRFTLASSAAPCPAFTLAEVLLTLAVIGIVAAITLPSLLVDTSEKAFDAQRRALHARLAQAIGTMANLSGYGEYVGNDSGVSTKDNAAETFLYEGLSKAYKMNNICGYDDVSTTGAKVLEKCNLPSTITTMAGTSMTFPTTLKELNEKLLTTGLADSSNSSPSDKSVTNTKVAAFETINGESIAVFSNPNCKNDMEAGTRSNKYTESTAPTPGDAGKTFDWFYVQNRMCVNFIYDLNGTKGPNKVGKDIGFITALYASNPEVVMPIPFVANVDTSSRTQRGAIDLCNSYSDDSRLPNKNELASMFYNMNLIGNMKTVSSYWSSSVVSSTYGWRQNFSHGIRGRHLRSTSFFVCCVRK